MRPSIRQEAAFLASCLRDKAPARTRPHPLLGPNCSTGATCAMRWARPWRWACPSSWCVLHWRGRATSCSRLHLAPSPPQDRITYELGGYAGYVVHGINGWVARDPLDLVTVARDDALMKMVTKTARVASSRWQLPYPDEELFLTARYLQQGLGSIGFSKSELDKALAAVRRPKCEGLLVDRCITGGVWVCSPVRPCN